MKRWTAVLACVCLLAACATTPQRSFEADAQAGNTAAAKPVPVCEPDPFCNHDCLRAYPPGYCRHKCGC